MRDGPEASDRELALMAANRRLEDRVQELEEALGVLILPPLEWGLTKNESRLLGVLLERELVTKDTAMAALYRDRGEREPELKIVDVFICKARKKLKPFGIVIDTRWGVGYSMSAASKAAARQQIAASAGLGVAA